MGGHGEESKCIMPTFVTLFFTFMSFLVSPAYELLEAMDKPVHLTGLSGSDCNVLQTGTINLAPIAEFILCICGQMTIQQAGIQVSCLSVDLFPLLRWLWWNASQRLQFFKSFQNKNLQ